jgi:hypothetical protein
MSQVTSRADKGVKLNNNFPLAEGRTAVRHPGCLATYATTRRLLSLGTLLIISDRITILADSAT